MFHFQLLHQRNILLKELNIIDKRVRWTWRKGARLFNKRASPNFHLQCLPWGPRVGSAPTHIITHRPSCADALRGGSSHKTQRVIMDTHASHSCFYTLSIKNSVCQSDIAQNNHVCPYRLNVFTRLVGFCRSTDVSAVSTVPDPC